MRPPRRLRRPTAATVPAVLFALAAHTAAPTEAGAQSERGRARYAVEAYAAQSWIDNQIGAGSTRPGGFGVRVTGVRDERGGGRTLAERAVGGAFATYTPRQGSPDITTLHVGLQTDIDFLPQPLGGHLDPFFSLGLGLFRTSRENGLATAGNNKRITRTDLAITPGVGTRVPFAAGVGLRGDLRAPVIIGSATTLNFVAEGGLYVTF